MHKKECPNEVKSAEHAVNNSVRDGGKTSQRVSEHAQAKMPPKDSRTARPVQGQVRKKRLLPVKALPIEGMREAAQLARSYIRAMETHSKGNQRQTSELCTSQGMSIPYEHLFVPGSMVNANSILFPQDLSLINQLHASGTLPGHMLNAGAMTVNKRPFLAAHAAEESRLKRLRKIVTSSALETLGPQAAAAKYGGNHSSPLLPSPPPRPCSVFDSRHEDPSFNYLQKSPPAHYSGDPPSPTPRKSSTIGKLTSDMRLDSSAFPSSDKLDHTAEFYDAKDHQIKSSSRVPISQHVSAKSSSDNYRNSLLQLHLSSLQPHTKAHMMPSFGNGEQKSQIMSDGTYLSHIDHEMPMGLSHLSRPELASYLGHIAALRNLPQHENSTHLGSGQHQEMAHRPNSLPSNPSAGILPLPVRPEFNGSGNNLNSLALLPPDAGILPLPGRSELAQMASLQQDLAAQAFNGSQHPLGQSVQLNSIPMQGDLASLQQVLSCQRSAGGHHPLYQSSQMQNHLQYLNEQLSAQRVMGSHHPLLPPLALQNDLATLQQELSAQQYNNASNRRVPLQGNLNALQQELAAQRLQNSLMQSPLQNDLASLQHELFTQRFNAGQHQYLQPYPMQGNLALFQQDLAPRGLNGGHQPFLHTFPVQGDVSALQQELDFQRLNGGAHPLMQASLQQQLSAQNFNGGHHPLLQTLQM